MRRVVVFLLGILTLASVTAAPARGADRPAPSAKDAAARGGQVVAKALAFLKAQQQENGSWQRSDREPVAITALVLRALVQDPKTGADAEAAKKAVAFLLAAQQPDGGIYKGMLANYNTAISVSALAAVNDPKLKEPIAKAVAYLKANQFTDAVAGANGEKIDANHPAYGGWGYGGTQGRPDVSNAAIVVEALKDAGVPQDDPAYQAALKFVTRMQNHSETNPAKWATDDGGFVYSPGRDGNGESSAGEYEDDAGTRRLRSYGSMTYAGLKSMIYAGLTKDDPRVKAAWDWIGKNWTVEENPGMRYAGAEAAKAGIFYFYHTLARALSVYGEPVVTDATGKPHDWRAELIDALAAAQKPDGSFVGDRKWMEDNPVIATVLVTLAAQDALRDLKDLPAK